jgi:hypothetical protein
MSKKKTGSAIYIANNTKVHLKPIAFAKPFFLKKLSLMSKTDSTKMSLQTNSKYHLGNQFLLKSNKEWK